MTEPTVRLRRAPGAPADHPAPSRAHATDAGLDLRASVSVVIHPGQCRAVPTGWVWAIAPGFEGQVRPRSGRSLRRPELRIANAPGTVDAGYRDEVKVIVHNTGDRVVGIDAGERIAQMVVAPVSLCVPVVVDELDETERGAAGFGSTGD